MKASLSQNSPGNDGEVGQCEIMTTNDEPSPAAMSIINPLRLSSKKSPSPHRNKRQTNQENAGVEYPDPSYDYVYDPNLISSESGPTVKICKNCINPKGDISGGNGDDLSEDDKAILAQYTDVSAYRLAQIHVIIRN